jgi:tetratricopeptide (TPR) repeat protein
MRRRVQPAVLIRQPGRLAHCISKQLLINLFGHLLRLFCIDAGREAGLGSVLFGRRDFRGALGHLETALASRRDDPKLLLTAALTYKGLHDLPKARALLERVGASGGDSTYALAVLAETDANRGDYTVAAAEAVRAIVGLKQTIARPFPGALEGALTVLANQAPPAVAMPVFERAVALRPSWQIGYWGGAVVNARLGGAACERAGHLAVGLEKFGWTADEIIQLVRRCLPRS